ncbi:hypothetical protein L6164_014123 [Bauhinia variegata]|uniref:Uncharacterized protein n=1 Tax=Bauhinia variegata TaxID=167791 RepID=A0ACB9NGK1_BAUVA|nr:hypothetical protein L6164_014123 [Bauhinia variegata]
MSLEMEKQIELSAYIFRNDETKTESPLSSPDENSTKNARFFQIRGFEIPQIYLFSSEKRILVFCLAFRMLNALLVQNYFNPDEHCQGPEVAHRITLGSLYWLKSVNF